MKLEMFIDKIKGNPRLNLLFAISTFFTGIALLLFFTYSLLLFQRDNGLSFYHEILVRIVAVVAVIVALFVIYNRAKISGKVHSFYIVRFLQVSKFLCSHKIQIEVFEPIIADWQVEYFEALFKKEIWKARWINVRYTYAFLAAMWQKSPIGDLIEFISKFWK